MTDVSQNLLFANKESNSPVKVVDFGLAKLYANKTMFELIVYFFPQFSDRTKVWDSRLRRSGGA